MIEILTIQVSPLQQNCRILLDTASKQAVVVDPGAEADRILGILTKKGVSCAEIWLTHSHLDHCGGVADLKKATGALVRAHAVESVMRAKVEEIAAMYGLPKGIFKNCAEPDSNLSGGETLNFAGANFEVRFTPGHSPGHVVFYCAEGNFLLAGDTVFAGSVGRTDLPGGSHQQLIASIREHILTLPDNVRILSGHGPDTLVGTERRSNPFLEE